MWRRFKQTNFAIDYDGVVFLKADEQWSVPLPWTSLKLFIVPNGIKMKMSIAGVFLSIVAFLSS